MIQEIRNAGFQNEKVLAAMAKVPRHAFVPGAALEHAYMVKAYQIDHQQTISDPFTVATQTHLLDLKPNDRVLEIGTGSGYQAAVLYEMGVKVYTIERWEELFLKTEQRLRTLGYGHIRTFLGDGYAGLERFAPFNKVIVTCGCEAGVPKTLYDQLEPEGIMVIPIGPDTGMTMCRIIKSVSGEPITSTHGTFKFVPFLTGIANSDTHHRSSQTKTRVQPSYKNYFSNNEVWNLR